MIKHNSRHFKAIYQMKPPMSARITSFASLQLGVAPWFILQPLSRNGWLDDLSYPWSVWDSTFLGIPKLRTPYGRMKNFWTSQLRPSLDSAKGIVARRNLPPSGNKTRHQLSKSCCNLQLSPLKGAWIQNPLAPFGPMILGATTVKQKHGMKFECSLPHANFWMCFDMLRWSMAKKNQSKPSKHSKPIILSGEQLVLTILREGCYPNSRPSEFNFLG